MGFFSQKIVCSNCGEVLGKNRSKIGSRWLCPDCIELYSEDTIDDNTMTEVSENIAGNQPELMVQSILAGLPDMVKNSIRSENTTFAKSTTITINGKTVKGNMNKELSRNINKIFDEAFGEKFDEAFDDEKAYRNQKLDNEDENISNCCNGCGAPKEPNAKFCGYCGASVK
jgi:formylmethanofuran dehydrogenase subunit E